MRTGRPEVNDINAKIRTQRQFGMEEALVRGMLTVVIGLLAHLLFVYWIGSFVTEQSAATLFTAGVTTLVALLVFVPFWNDYKRQMGHLKETKRRLETRVNVPPPSDSPSA